MENRQSKKTLKREDVNLNYLSDKDFETAKKEIGLSTATRKLNVES
jgi:hypothetical protein